MGMTNEKSIAIGQIVARERGKGKAPTCHFCQ